MELKEKERILEASRERFFEHGFGKVTLDEISADLGMSKKTLYKFFPSKEDLVKAVVHLTMQNVKRQVESIVTSDKPVVEKFSELLAFIGRIWGRAGRQLPIDMKRFFPALWKEVEAFRREHVLSNIRKLFFQAKQEGILKTEVDPDLLMLMFLNCVEGILNPTTLAEHSFSLTEAFRGIFRILFEGALTESARQQFRMFEPSSPSNI